MRILDHGHVIDSRSSCPERAGRTSFLRLAECADGGRTWAMIRESMPRPPGLPGEVRATELVELDGVNVHFTSADAGTLGCVSDGTANVAHDALAAAA